MGAYPFYQSPYALLNILTTPPTSNITIDFLDNEGTLLDVAYTDTDGHYSFTDLDPGDYLVQLVVPLGFSVDQNDVPVSLSAGETATIDFELTPIVVANDARSKGYWKHQVTANLSNKGNPEYTTAELESFAQEIYEHFYLNVSNPIQVDGVTYISSTGLAPEIGDLQTMLNINQGGSTMFERACQQYLALLLNVVSDKLGQYMMASDDGATVSQAIVYIDQLLGEDDELAKDIAETLNQAQTVSAGVIPLSTPNVIFGNDKQAVVMVPSEFIMYAYPNPFNPSTKLTFFLPTSSPVNLAIFDIQGRLVANLVDGFRDAGVHEVYFDAAGLPSGIYCARLVAVGFGESDLRGGHSATQKLVLMK